MKLVAEHCQSAVDSLQKEGRALREKIRRRDNSLSNLTDSEANVSSALVDKMRDVTNSYVCLPFNFSDG